jgi:hypothetical protein
MIPKNGSRFSGKITRKEKFAEKLAGKDFELVNEAVLDAAGAKLFQFESVVALAF